MALQTLALDCFRLLSIAFHCFCNDQNFQECFDCLQTSQRDARPLKRTIQRWFEVLRDEKTTMGRKGGSGRWPTAVTDANIAAVSRMVDADPWMIYQQIEHQLDIGSRAVNAILKDRLGLKKLCARWAPHGLTVGQKTARREFPQGMLHRYIKKANRRLMKIVTGDETWAYYYDQLKKLHSMKLTCPNQRRSCSVKKHVLIMFFNYSGVVSKFNLLQRQKERSVTFAFYVNKILKPLLPALRKKYPKSGNRRILLHHDNAPSHTAVFTKLFLRGEKSQFAPPPALFRRFGPLWFLLVSKADRKAQGTDFHEAFTGTGPRHQPDPPGAF